MYDRRFFTSQLGLAAALSVAAMITFALFAGSTSQPASARDGASGAIVATLA